MFINRANLFLHDIVLKVVRYAQRNCGPSTKLVFVRLIHSFVRGLKLGVVLEVSAENSQFETWVISVIFVGIKGQWCIAGLMLHAYACHVIVMSTLLMPCPGVTLGHCYVKDVIPNPHQ